MIRFCAPLIIFAGQLWADTIVSVRTIPAQAIITSGDLAIEDETTPGTASMLNDVIGMEARVALFAGRPIRLNDVGPPALVERNQIIPLHYENAGLVITTDGRALGRAAPGDRIRVMNLSSRATVSARIGQDGAAYVQQ